MRLLPIGRFGRQDALGLALAALAALVYSGCGGTARHATPSGSYAISLSTAAVTLVPGASEQFTAQVTGSGGFSEKVRIVCLGAPEGVTVSPASITVAAGTSGIFTLSAATNAPEDSTQLACSGTAVVQGSAAQLGVTLTFDNASFVPTTIDLPIVTITTTGGVPIVSKDVYVTGHLSINPNGANLAPAYEGDMQIRGRGHSSWDISNKKPYKIKLNSKASLFGFPSDKEWVLLANFSDKTLLRNMVAMELSRRFQLPFTPHSTPVEVFLNGNYRGTYLLMESIKIAANRVNIPSMAATDTTGVPLTGGYLLEVDERRDGTTLFETTHQLPVTVHDPDPAAPEQLVYISDYFEQVEATLDSDNFADPAEGYAKYLDSDTFLNWYLANEINSNVDAAFFSSCWMYKQRSDKLYMGPAWDFDLAFGNVDYADSQFPIGWYVRQGPWLNRMFQDPVFAQKAKDRWNALKPGQIDTIFTYIDQQAEVLNRAQQNNFQRWPIMNEYVWPVPAIPGTYQGEVDQLKGWLTQRITWMDTAFNQ